MGGVEDEGIVGNHCGTDWLADIDLMCKQCHYDRRVSKFVVFTPPDGSCCPHIMDIDQAVDVVFTPLWNVLLKRRWPKVAQSRWTGVLSCLGNAHRNHHGECPPTLYCWRSCSVETD